MSELLVSIRPAGATGANAYAYKQIAAHELIDGSGANVLGGGPISQTFQAYVVEARKQTSSILDDLGHQSATIVMEFGDGRADMGHGTLSGYIPMDGTYRLALTMRPDFVPGSYEVRVSYLAAARMTIAGGSVKVSPS